MSEFRRSDRSLETYSSSITLLQQTHRPDPRSIHYLHRLRSIYKTKDIGGQLCLPEKIHVVTDITTHLNIPPSPSLSTYHAIRNSGVDTNNLQFPINVYRIPHLHLHLPDPLAGLGSLLSGLKRRFKLITPRTPPAVPVAIVIT